MSVLRFPGRTLADLRAALLRSTPNEAAAMVLVERVPVPGDVVLLAREVIIAPEDHIAAEPLRVQVSAEFIAHVLKSARLEQLGVFFVHTHPAATDAWFSAQDDLAERILMPTLFQRAPGGPHGAIVLTATDCVARWYGSPDEVPTPLTLVEVGPSLSAWDGTRRDSGVDLTVDRTVRAIGDAGQKRLERARVAIVGLGGLGSIVAQQLAHLGVGDLLLLDPEAVEPTNLNRLVGSTPSSVGEAKVEVAARMARALRPSSRVQALQGDVRFEGAARNLIESDLVFCCTDSHGSRAVLNQLAHQYFVPVIDAGVRIDAADGRISSIVGRVQLIAPGLACLACENLLDPEQVRRDLLTDEERKRDPYIVGALEPQPSVISLNGVVGSLAVTMFLSVVCGVPLDSRHQMFLADRGLVRNVASAADPGCYVCSPAGAKGRGDRWTMPWRRG